MSNMCIWFQPPLTRAESPKLLQITQQKLIASDSCREQIKRTTLASSEAAGKLYEIIYKQIKDTTLASSEAAGKLCGSIYKQIKDNTLASSEAAGKLCGSIYKQIKDTMFASSKTMGKFCEILNNFKLTTWKQFKYVTQHWESFK